MFQTTSDEVFDERSVRRILSDLSSDRDLMRAQLGGFCPRRPRKSPSWLPSEI